MLPRDKCWPPGPPGSLGRRPRSSCEAQSKVRLFGILRSTARRAQGRKLSERTCLCCRHLPGTWGWWRGLKDVRREVGKIKLYVSCKRFFACILFFFVLRSSLQFFFSLTALCETLCHCTLLPSPRPCWGDLWHTPQQAISYGFYGD